MKKVKKSNKIFIIHTSDVTLGYLKKLFKELAPEVIIQNIIDDSLISEVIANNGVTKSVTRRLCTYAVLAEAAGANLIFNQCSSVGEAADVARELINIPLVKIDEKMAEEACKIGKNIGVIATLITTLAPTSRLMKKTADKVGKEIKIVEKLCEGAFERLVTGDKNTHNKMVIKAIRELSNNVDVIVCAQGSMVALLPELAEINIPVLTSPRLGVENVIEVLKTIE